VVQLRHRVEEVRDQPRAARRGGPRDVAPRAAVPDRHHHAHTAATDLRIEHDAAALVNP
jgi:hypothetical protein